jgi:hypothetical protein
VSAVARLFGEWFDKEWDPAVSEYRGFDKEDLAGAFAAGWEACYHARWEPVGGLPVSPPAQALIDRIYEDE